MLVSKPNDHGYSFTVVNHECSMHYFAVTDYVSVVTSGFYKGDNVDKLEFSSTLIPNDNKILLSDVYELLVTCDGEIVHKFHHIRSVMIKNAHRGDLYVSKSNIIQNMFDVPGYEDLAGVLAEAYGQAARGKGKERHANQSPFKNQPIMRISRGRSGIGGLSYQIQKKADEAIGMVERGKHEAACKELMGSIVYAAAMILLIREKNAGELPVSDAPPLA